MMNCYDIFDTSPVLTTSTDTASTMRRSRQMRKPILFAAIIVLALISITCAEGNFKFDVEITNADALSSELNEDQNGKYKVLKIALH